MKGKMVKPTNLLTLEHRKYHGSNKALEERREHEKKMQFGDQVFVPSDNLLKSEYAVAKWNELVRLYKRVDFVNEIDVGLLEQYCITHSEWYQILDAREEIREKGWDAVKTFHAMEELKLDYNENKKLEMLLKMGDRLFLNPVTRMKCIPTKQDEKPKSQLESLGFGEV